MLLVKTRAWRWKPAAFVEYDAVRSLVAPFPSRQELDQTEELYDHEGVASVEDERACG